MIVLIFLCAKESWFCLVLRLGGTDRELGLLRKRSTSGHPDLRWKRLRAKCQIFAYLIVIDFESTCWENDKSTPQEIIEFPAVLLNTATGQIEDEFHTYVMPQDHPTLSKFCSTLTGILQGQVDNGLPIAICLSKFSRWLNRLAQEKKICYNKEEEGFLPCTFVTWSDWDLGVCLFYECRRKQIRKPPPLNSWLDLRATYKKFYERRPNGLNGALKDLGIEFEGREHSGLDDARNTAKLAWRMIKDGCIMTITKSLDGKHIKAAPSLTSTFKPIPLSNQHQVIVDVHQPNKACTPNQQNNHMNGPQKRSVLNFKTTDHFDEQFSTTTSKEKEGDLRSKVKDNSDCDKCVSDIEDCDILVSENEDLLETSTNILELGMCEPDDSVCNVMDNIKDDVCVSKHLDIKDLKENEINQTNGNFVKARSSCAERKDSPKKSINPVEKSFNPSQTFKVHSDVPKGSHETQGTPPVRTINSTPYVLKDKKNTYIANNVPKGKREACPTPKYRSNRTPSSSSLQITDQGKQSVKSGFKTPVVPLNMHNSSMKVTPPLCKCGRRSKRRVAQTPGPNIGRSFFSCPQGSSAKNRGCGYFQWESAYLQNHSPQLFASPFAYAQKSGFKKQELESVAMKLSYGTQFDSTRKSLGIRPVVNKRI